MNRPLAAVSAAVILIAGSLAIPSSASMFGPWVRYANPELGFRTLAVSDWRVIPVRNGVVFVMQSHPQPYVRMAIGKIAAGTESFDTSIRTLVTKEAPSDKLSLVACKVGGRKAFMVEGPAKTGYSRDYYVDHGDAWYWISFNADKPDLWAQYSKSFDIILQDFQFL